MKTISSRLTFVMKFIFPFVWISGFGIGTLGLVFGSAHNNNGELPTTETKMEFLTAWILGTAFILWNCAGLKKVRMDRTHLHVSNFRKEIAVPFVDVEDITEYRFFNLPTAIHFRTPTEFGQSIKFLSPDRFIPFYWGWQHPVIEDLKERVGLKDR